MTATADRTSVDDLTLQPAEQAVLEAEIPAFAASLRDPQLRARYAELAVAVEAGVIPADLIGLVEAMAELLLQAQRIRRTHGPEGERALAAVFDRTPRGEGLRRSSREVNEALEALRGQTLEGVRFSPTPGGHRLVLTTAQGQLQLAIDRVGVRVEHIELGSALA